MDEIKDGGPAFPVLHSIDGNWVKEPMERFRGMTLRDYFAAKAMAALLTRVNDVTGDYVTNATPDQGAEDAYRFADAMLRAREANHG